MPRPDPASPATPASSAECREALKVDASGLGHGRITVANSALSAMLRSSPDEKRRHDGRRLMLDRERLLLGDLRLAAAHGECTGQASTEEGEGEGLGN